MTAWLIAVPAVWLIVATVVAGCAGLGDRGWRTSAGPPRPDHVTASGESLVGTAWQLVRFQGGDGTTLVPGADTRYTLVFTPDGSLSARIDCNRGRGTWKSLGPNHVELGPMVTTRAICPRGSLHDRMVRHLPFVRSYLMKDGHLFLSLMADGGIYEFEPGRE